MASAGASATLVGSSLADAFFDAQDLLDAGETSRARECLRQVAEMAEQLRNSDAAGEPPAPLVASAASNCLAELAIDEAISLGFPLGAQRGAAAAVERARAHLARALAAWPENAQAAVSLGLLERDCGSPDAALRAWSAAAALPLDAGDDGDGDGDGDDDWRAAWLVEPRRRCVPLAAMQCALLLSQLGRHAEAAPLLRRFGFRRRLTAAVWAAARAPPKRGRAAARRRRRAAAAAAAAAAADFRGAGACPVAVFAEAVPPALEAQLRRAFAPGAAYFAETGYEGASEAKRYFTFAVDVARLASGAAAPATAVEEVVVRLAALLGRDDLVWAEWWVHSRLGGRSAGHELHFDLEERTLETGGRVLHPAVSSVVYLSDGDDPTVVFDETLGGAPAARGWAVHPRRRSFLAFRGDLLHGVLPSAPRAAAAGAAQRLTLLIAWYAAAPAADAAAGRRAHRLGALSSVPRATRRCTWPDALRTRAPPAADAAAAPPPAAAVATPPEMSPVWEAVRPAAAAAAAAAAESRSRCRQRCSSTSFCATPTTCGGG